MHRVAPGATRNSEWESPVNEQDEERLEALLAESAISDEVGAERGYRRITAKEDAEALGFSAAQAKRLLPGWLVPSYGPDKQINGHQIRADKKDSTAKYESPKGASLWLDCPPRIAGDLANVDVPLWVTEGVKKADAAVSAGLCCVAVTGVDCWRDLPEWEAVALRGRTVYVAYDSDAMTKESVDSALRGLTRFLTLRGAHVLWVYLPQGEKNPIDNTQKKTGLDDYLAAGGTIEQLLLTAQRPDPAIRVDGQDLRDLTREAVAALAAVNDPPTLFQRDGKLVESQSLGVAEVTRDRLRFLLGEAAFWYRLKVVDGKIVGKRPTEVPPTVISNVAAAPELWPFPVLDRIVTTPVFARDHTLRSTPGYHPASRSLYVPPDDLVMPEVSMTPTKGEVQEARALIDDLFYDFKFVSEADRTHAIVLLLQPFAREIIRGETPMYSVEAPIVGTGKGLLVSSALIPAAGGSLTSFAEPHGDEEMEKRLTSAINDAMPVLFFDNMDRFISYPSLASALTKSSWTGRLLGQSATMTMPITCTFVLTANNPRFSPDIERRVVRIRMDAGLENPSMRQGFRHSLPAWALQNRGRLVWAACTLIAAWVVRGKPGPAASTPILGSYNPWRYVMGGICEVHGYADFLSNRAAEEDAASPDRDTLETILNAANEKYGESKWFMAKDLAHTLYHDDYETPVVVGRDHATYAQSLGYFLRAHNNQLINGFRLERAPKDKRRSNGYPWRFVAVEDQ